MNVRRRTLSFLMALSAFAGLLALACTPALARKEYAPAAAFGGEGTGKGQFVEPAGVAVNDSTELVAGAGDVYVADKGNSRVERFSAAGAYLGQFNGGGTFEVEGKVEKGAAAPSGAISSPALLAVDDSGKSVIEDPSVGDVYVVDPGHKAVDKFGPLGEYLSQITEAQGRAFVQVLGVGVDSAGDVWVLQSPEQQASPFGEVDKFSDTGSFTERVFGVEQANADGIAVDSSGNAYVGARGEREERTSHKGLLKREISGERVELAEGVSAFAIDSSTHDVLADKGSAIELLGPFGEPYFKPLQTFPSEGLRESHGIAVNGATAMRTVYASQSGADDVAVFDYVLLPTVSTEAVSGLNETVVTLNGTVDTEGEAVTECKFEYGTETSYGQSVPCKQTPAEITALSKGGTVPVKVSAEVAGLQARTPYDFRLDAADGLGIARGSNEAFYTFARPAVENEAVVSVGSTEASVSARINPGGEPTGYRVQYGRNSVEEHSTPEASAGTARTPVNVVVTLSKLEAGATYHFRFVASNSLGATPGGETALTTTGTQVVSAPTESNCPNRTFSGFNPALPDCRAYELVSNPIDETYLPEYGETNSEPNGEAGGTGEFVGLPESFYAAVTGEAVAYMGGESNSGVGGNGATGDGDGNQYLAARGAKGWEASDVSLPINPNLGLSKLTSFSPDLSVQTVSTSVSGTETEIIGAEPGELAECVDNHAGGIYSRDAGGLHALVTMNQGSGLCYGEAAGISADDSHILFQSGGPYTAQAKQGNLGELNLYDSVGGVVHQVNVLPDGEPESKPNATFGARYGRISEFGTITDEVADISADGSHVFWTALEGSENAARPKALYVRENDAQPQSPVAAGGCTVSADACTEQVDAAEPGAPGPSGAGQFWATAGDGSKAFFTDCNRLTAGSTADSEQGCVHKESENTPVFTGNDLYEYDLEKPVGQRLTDLTVDHNPGDALGANVQGVVGVSEDGSYVYFVAEGVLAGANAEGKAPVAGQPNLYVSHGGATTFVVTFTSADDTILNQGGGTRIIGDWQVTPGARAAEVSPDGSAIGFLSRQELTGYDNNGIVGYHYENNKPNLSEPFFEHLPEAFVYQVATGRILCASCNPTGAAPAPVGLTQYANRLNGTMIGVSEAKSFMPRWVADREGTQVYFMTSQPLVADDSNGLQDVYEWQSEGSGGCRRAAGCISLISSAEPSSNAYFVDSAANGRDVFFTTRSPLTAGGAGERLKLYDARAAGGREEPSLSCTGTGCQGIPPAPPIFATPSSVTFNGVGNFEPSPAVKPKATPKKRPAKCRRGLRRKGGRCVRSGARKAGKSRARKAGRSVKSSRGGGK